MTNITKEQVLANIEEVKEFSIEAEQEKKEEKVVGIAIKNRFTGEIIFQSTKTTYKEAIIEKGNADLSDADLSDANLSDAELASAKFYGRGGTKQLTKAQLPDFLGALGFVIVD